MDVFQKLFEAIANAKDFSLFVSGLSGGWALSIWYHRKILGDLRSDSALLRVDVARIKEERDELRGDLKEAKTNYELENTKYETEAKRYQEMAKAGTIRCKICGSSMKREREYRNNQLIGAPEYVELKCANSECGQSIPMSIHDIRALTTKA